MSTINPKLVVAGILLAIIMLVAVVFTYQSKEINTLHKEAGKAEVVQEIQQGAIEVQTDSAKIIDKSVAQAAVKEQVAVEATRTRKVELEKKLVEIDAKYEQLPDLPEMDRVKEHEKSLARLESMREAYCMTGPNLKGCPSFEYVTIKKE